MKKVSVIAVALFVFVGLTGCPEKGKVEGKDGKKMTVTAPSSTSLKPGETKEITVKVKREKFNDPVSVSFSGLPEGVRVKEKGTKIDKGNDEATFTLKADDDAKPAKSTAKVNFKSGEMEKTEEFQVTVKEAK